MHYTIKYDQKDRTEKFMAALADSEDYLGKEKCEEVIELFANDWSTAKARHRIYNSQLMRLAMFAGIQGVPARALIRAGYARHKGRAK